MVEESLAIILREKLKPMKFLSVYSTLYKTQNINLKKYLNRRIDSLNKKVFQKTKLNDYDIYRNGGDARRARTLHH